MWPRGWVEVKLYSSMTAALEGGEWSAACPSRILPPGKTRYPFYRRLGGPQDWSGWAEKSLPHQDSILDHPARSQSLYRLSYPAHCYTEYIKSKGIHIVPHTVYTVITLAHFRNRSSQSKTKLCTGVLISP